MSQAKLALDEALADFGRARLYGGVEPDHALSVAAMAIMVGSRMSLDGFALLLAPATEVFGKDPSHW